MKMPKIGEILEAFKDLCKVHGWKTSEKDDWIKTKSGYHSFLWTREIQLSSFRSIAANRKCVVRKGLSYRVVEASYTAWLFSETPSEIVAKEILENPDFSERVALYNLNPLLEGRSIGFKLNYTNSDVFQEFERFLEKEFEVKLKPFFKHEDDSRKHAMTNLA